MNIFTGERNNYRWIEWQWRIKCLDQLLAEFPQIALGKYLVNTALDSGPLNLSIEEIAQGWRKYGDLALSPRITDVATLPYTTYDEWYVFPAPTTFDTYEVFVNYGDLSLHTLKPTKKIVERFWHQLERLAPESYLAEGESLFLVTSDLILFNQIVCSLTVLAE